MAATYTKLRDGGWGVRISGLTAAVAVGQPVVVTKKSGEVKTEVVTRVLWAAGDLAICVVASSYAAAPRPYSGGGRRRPAYRTRRGGAALPPTPAESHYAAPTAAAPAPAAPAEFRPVDPAILAQIEARKAARAEIEAAFAWANADEDEAGQLA